MFIEWLRKRFIKWLRKSIDKLDYYYRCRDCGAYNQFHSRFTYVNMGDGTRQPFPCDCRNRKGQRLLKILRKFYFLIR